MNTRISDGRDCGLPPVDGFDTLRFAEKGRLNFLFPHWFQVQALSLLCSIKREGVSCPHNQEG